MEYSIDEIKAGALAVVNSQTIPNVTSNEDYLRAGDVLKVLSNEYDKLEAKRKEYTAPLLESKKKIDADFKKILEPIDDVIAKIKEKMKVFYLTEKESKDKEQKLLEDAARANGDTSVAIVNDLKTQYGEIATVSAKKKKVFVVMDETMVPREFLMIDEKKIKAHMDNNFENPPAGIKYEYDITIATR